MEPDITPLQKFMKKRKKSPFRKRNFLTVDFPVDQISWIEMTAKIRHSSKGFVVRDAVQKKMNDSNS